MEDGQFYLGLLAFAAPGAFDETLSKRLYREMRVYQRLPKKPAAKAKRPK